MRITLFELNFYYKILGMVCLILTTILLFAPTAKVFAHPLPRGVNHNTTVVYSPDTKQLKVKYELYMFYKDIEALYQYIDLNNDKTITVDEARHYEDLMRDYVYFRNGDQDIKLSSISDITQPKDVVDTIYSSVYFSINFDLSQSIKDDFVTNEQLPLQFINTYTVQSDDIQDWNLFYGANTTGEYTDFTSTQRSVNLKTDIEGQNNNSNSWTIPKLNLFDSTKSTLEKFLHNEGSKPLTLLYLFSLALLFGIAHTFTPGHGKAVISAYMAAVHGTIKDAAIIATSMTISHTGIVILLSLAYVFLKSSIKTVIPIVNIPITIPEINLQSIVPYLPIFSGTLIIIIALFMLVQRIKTYSEYKVHKALHEAGHEHAHNEHLDDSHKTTPTDHYAHEHDAAHVHSHSHGAHKHTHIPHHRLTVREGIWLGVTTGFNPCVDAITLLIISINLGAALLGLGLLLTFSSGMALTLIGMGWVIGKGIHVGTSKTQRGEEILQILPIISTLLILVTGLLLVF